MNCAYALLGLFFFRVGECKFDFFSVSGFMFRRFLLSDLG